MKIKEITSQNRRDFYATMECEHCGHIEENVSGYDDAFFHKEVIPKMKCSVCKKTAPDNYRPLTTKYPEEYTV
jgi:primosomal protein N'